MAEADVVYSDRGAEHFGDVAALLERVFREEYEMPLAERIAKEVDAARRGFDSKRDLLATAERAGRMAGVLLVTHDDHDAPGSGLFDWLVVEGAACGLGIGRELIFRGVEACRQRGIAVLRARCFAFSPGAPHLFWLHGFRVIDLRSTNVGGQPREVLLFEKRLTPPSSA
jgi:predicted N-acetyltransferase YhbS